jgi:hypothetical protein
MIAGLIKAIFPPIAAVIDKAVTDKDAALQLKANIQTALLSLEGEQLKAATSVILAEANGKSWLQRNWRPVTMLAFVGTVVGHMYGLTPDDITPEEAMSLFDLVKIGLGGYVVGRSAEKIVPQLLSKR